MLRGRVKGALAGLGRTGPGRHAVHAAMAGDRRALHFSDLERWPEKADRFEDLDFLFTSSQLEHGIASLRLDEAALLFRLGSGVEHGTIVELGRFKGGSTFVLGVAKGREAQLWSYDLHAGHADGATGEELDGELGGALERYGLDGIHVVVADTRTVPIPEGPIDLLFVDADHRYAGARADYERWSPQVAPGGHLLFHDAVDTGGWGTTYPELQRLAAEVERDGRFVRRPDAGTIAWFTRQESSA